MLILSATSLCLVQSGCVNTNGIGPDGRPTADGKTPNCLGPNGDEARIQTRVECGPCDDKRKKDMKEDMRKMMEAMNRVVIPTREGPESPDAPPLRLRNVQSARTVRSRRPTLHRAASFGSQRMSAPTRPARSQRSPTKKAARNQVPNPNSVRVRNPPTTIRTTSLGSFRSRCTKMVQDVLQTIQRKMSGTTPRAQYIHAPSHTVNQPTSDMYIEKSVIPDHFLKKGLQTIYDDAEKELYRGQQLEGNQPTKDIFRFLVQEPGNEDNGCILYGRMKGDKIVECAPSDITDEAREAWRTRDKTRRLMERLLRYENHYSSGAGGYPPKNQFYSA